jgi:hypothetical protein
VDGATSSRHANAVACCCCLSLKCICWALLLLFVVLLQAAGPAGQSLLQQLPRNFLSQGVTLWQQQLVPAVVRSPFHSEVLGTLAAMKLPAVCEGVTPDGMFSVDIIVKFRGCQVAIEAMGTEHFTVNKVSLPTHHHQQQKQQDSGTQPQPSPRRRTRKQLQQQRQQVLQEGHEVLASEKQISGSNPTADDHAVAGEPRHMLLGPDLLRMRLLAARGYGLATVSSYEWEQVRGKTAAQQQLLQQKLEDAVAALKAAPAALAADAASATKPSKALAHRRRQQQQRVDVAAAAAAEEEQQDEQQWQRRQLVEGPVVAQQVARLMQQQGRSGVQQKGLLRQERYKQQRQQLHQQGVQLLLMAAPWAKSRSKQQQQALEASSAEGVESSRVGWGSAVDALGADGIGSTEAAGAAADATQDEDFNIDLDLDDLLNQQ